MKHTQLIILLLIIILPVRSIRAQAVDMMVASPSLEVVPGASSHTVSLGFTVLAELGAHLLSSDQNAPNFAEVRITLTNLDGADVLPGGPGASLFNWSYIPTERTYIGRSKDVMLTEDNRYRVQLADLLIHSTDQSGNLGFTVLLLPPKDLLGSEAQDDSLAYFQQAPLTGQFTAVKQNRVALISALVSPQAQANKLEVERSSNGINWNKIGEIDANITPDLTRAFEFKDLQPKNGLNLYRLKVIDQNNKAKYSIERRVIFDDNEREILYPNPLKANEKLNLLNSEIDQITAVRIFDSSGRQVYQSEVVGQIDTSGFSAGSYLVQLAYTDGSTSTHRVVKQ